MTKPLTRDELFASLTLNEQGLLPVVAQDHKTREVLMLAWMNRDALQRTLESGDVTYWSRSRQKLWRKGETSGHTQRLIEARIDCDGDTLLLLVEQKGPACHTGEANCFFRPVKNS
ncbi:MAG TPA: phosphoribosyl-AMP cyclohydrolase [Alphaproteobacteria bacterium]|nr:phosphoribosyl-AMP cyclohydrolase [Alphaproteobacteria bacterium]